MKLEVHERIALLELIPSQGSYAELAAIRKAREIISFTQEEIDFFRLTLENKTYNWDQARAAQRVLDAPMEQYIIETVRKKLSEMESTHTMKEMYMSLYEKFIINYRAVE